MRRLGFWFLAAFVVLILFTYVVYIPIRKITKAADEYAAGNFEKKVDVHSNDEIGYLAASLNYMANELNTLEDDQKKFVFITSLHDFRFASHFHQRLCGSDARRHHSRRDAGQIFKHHPL